MVKQLAFFVEGEENPKDKRDEMRLRQTLRVFFAALVEQAEARGIRLQFRLFGSRRATYEKFREALGHELGVFCVLLVDSEDPVKDENGAWEHLRSRAADGWERPAGAEDDQCQLMVQAIEAWLFADVEALASFYGQGFRSASLPKTQNVERILKARHLDALEAATKDTSKGRYHKVKHLSPLLFRISAEKVRKRAPHCDRIIATLSARIETLNQ